MAVHAGPYDIRMTPEVREDLRTLKYTKAEFAQIVTALEAVADKTVGQMLRDWTPQVCRVAQTNGKCFRLKLPELKTRVAFVIDECDHLLIVIAVVRRDKETYDIFEMRYDNYRRG
jgi:mRNA-degrading endonuclease RelE of RelBE toxin-antitoxin system